MTETLPYIYHSQMHPVLKRITEVCSATDWLAALTANIPNAGEHRVRYDGWYSNVNRETHRKTQGEMVTAIAVSSQITLAEAKRAWARRIRSRSPCLPSDGGPIRIIAVIEQPAVTEKSLTHLGTWAASAHTSPVAGFPLPCSRQWVVAA